MPVVVEESPRVRSVVGEPAWEIAQLFPLQGQWSEADYLALDSNRLVELADGRIQVLPMPTLLHSFIAMHLVVALQEFLVRSSIGGRAAMAPVPVRLFPGTYREPDVFYLNASRMKPMPKYPDGAELVFEVVSEGVEDRNRDYVEKRHDYAKAGIPEYWIVDPQEKKITVLVLDGETYCEHGVFESGTVASSVRLAGFSVNVSDVWAAGEGPTP